MRRARDSYQRAHLLTSLDQALDEPERWLGWLGAQSRDTLDAFDYTVYMAGRWYGYRSGYRNALEDDDHTRVQERIRLGLPAKHARKRGRKAKR
jgi:hypothetical protein